VRPLWVFLAFLTAGLGSSKSVAAQAWVPPRGGGTVSATYQNYRHSGHFDRLGHKNTNGATQSQVCIAQLDFGVTDSLALQVTLPLIASKYTGPPFYFVEGQLTLPGPLDDGTYHAAFQDLRIEARRLVVVGPVALAPFFSGSMPTHAYETQGEAVPGRHRRELQAGVSAGTEWNALVPRLQVHARYAYAALERTNGFPHTRSNIDIEVGPSFTPRFEVHAISSWQIRHEGPTIPQLIPDWVNHDRFVNSSYLDLGAGGSFSLDHSTELYGLWVTTVRGSRGAHVARILAVGVSRSFGGGFRGLGR